MQGELLSGGRTTPGVERIGDRVHRPMKANSPFVHEVLSHLEAKGIYLTPRFYGIDARNREILSYVSGYVPENIGLFCDKQICAAVQLLKSLHNALADFPGVPAGKTVCHGDASPCNFVFTNPTGLPFALIDWDAAHIGDPVDDLAYAMWLWLDIGSDMFRPDETYHRMQLMAQAYALPKESFTKLPETMIAHMRRVSQSVFLTVEQTAATHAWAEHCLVHFAKTIAPFWQ